MEQSTTTNIHIIPFYKTTTWRIIFSVVFVGVAAYGSYVMYTKFSHPPVQSPEQTLATLKQQSAGVVQTPENKSENLNELIKNSKKVVVKNKIETLADLKALDSIQ